MIKLQKKVGIWLTMLSNDVEPQDSTVFDSLSEENLIELANLVIENKLSATAAKEVFYIMIDTHEKPSIIAKDKGLFQVTDTESIVAIVSQIINDSSNKNAIDDIKSGNLKAIGFLVGQVMKLSKGSANPSAAQKIIIEEIDKL